MVQVSPKGQVTRQPSGPLSPSSTVTTKSPQYTPTKYILFYCVSFTCAFLLGRTFCSCQQQPFAFAKLSQGENVQRTSTSSETKSLGAGASNEPAVPVADIPDKQHNPFGTLCADKNNTVSRILSESEVIRIAKEFYRQTNQKPTLIPLGHAIMDHAMQTNQMVFTLQIGGMDGISNDPMHGLWMHPKFSGRYKDIPKTHWLPVVIEPVPDNFKALTKSYNSFVQDHGLVCHGLSNSAISYDENPDGCTFCHFNTADSAPQVCQDHPDWMKYQLGSLDCAYQKWFFNKNFETCILQAKIMCGTVAHLLEKSFQLDASVTPISLLQVDVEGYEHILLPGLLDELKIKPPILHYEDKVMKAKDRKDNFEEGAPGSRIGNLTLALKKHGYHALVGQGEDMLALRFDPTLL